VLLIEVGFQDHREHHQFHFGLRSVLLDAFSGQTAADEVEQTPAAIESRMSLTAMSPRESLEQQPHQDSLQWPGPLVR
jgi:hypothetical protein